MSKILVTGATGTVGAQVLRMLADRGASVRAAVRDPAKLASMKDVQVVAYDIEQGAGVDEAFAGVDRVFLLTPFVPGFADLTRRAIDAARAAGVKHVVKLSAAGADPQAPVWLAHQHGLGDRAVADSGLSYTILRPTFFQDNILNYSGDSLSAQGTFYGASSDQKVTYVSSRDVAAVAVEALLHPERHAGQTYDLTGNEALSGDELARLLSEASGRSITYTNVSLEQYAEGARGGGMSEAYVEAFTFLENVKAQGWAASVSPHVPQILGRAPETYAEFLARNRDRL